VYDPRGRKKSRPAKQRKNFPASREKIDTAEREKKTRTLNRNRPTPQTKSLHSSFTRRVSNSLY
jgi:hypothetical protein